MAVRPRVQRARRLAFGAWAALVALECLWHLGPAFPPDLAALGLAIVPLLLPLLAMRRPNRALLWAGIIAIFYFAHGVSDAWTMPAARGPAIIEALLAVVLVTAVGMGMPARVKAESGDAQPR